jgi:hypothetical protein
MAIDRSTTDLLMKILLSVYIFPFDEVRDASKETLPFRSARSENDLCLANLSEIRTFSHSPAISLTIP